MLVDFGPISKVVKLFIREIDKIMFTNIIGLLSKMSCGYK